MRVPGYAGWGFLPSYQYTRGFHSLGARSEVRVGYSVFRLEVGQGLGHRYYTAVSEVKLCIIDFYKYGSTKN